MSASRQIVCGECGEINRLPARSAAVSARCGSCHQPIFDGYPVDVDEEGLDRHLEHTDIPVLVDVWAPWCGPCRAMAPMFERAAGALEPKARLLMPNADTAPSVSSRLRISGFPTVLLMQGGREVLRTFGAMDTKGIIAWTMAGLARSR